MAPPPPSSPRLFPEGWQAFSPIPRPGLLTPGTEARGAALGRGSCECGGVWNPPAPARGLVAARTPGLGEGVVQGHSVQAGAGVAFPAPRSTLEQLRMRKPGQELSWGDTGCSEAGEGVHPEAGLSRGKAVAPSKPPPPRSPRAQQGRS